MRGQHKALTSAKLQVSLLPIHVDGLHYVEIPSIMDFVVPDGLRLDVQPSLGYIYLPDWRSLSFWHMQMQLNLPVISTHSSMIHGTKSTGNSAMHLRLDEQANSDER